MIEAVLDASALIAFLKNEPGADRVPALLSRSCISAINLAEVFGKMVEYDKPLDAVAFQIERLQIPVMAFDGEQAKIAASLWPTTRAAGLSLADRACLALALKQRLPVLTTDRIWAKVQVGLEIQMIRP